MKINCPVEHVEHVNVVKWMNQNYPGVIIWTIPNGAKLSPQTVSKLKSEGLHDGAPDLEIPAWDIYIEMKRVDPKVCKVYPEQIATIEYLQECGKHATICYGAQEAIDFIQSVLDKHPRYLQIKARYIKPEKGESGRKI